ncbi:MAG: G5 domain-containing protein [Peptoniphilus duerdenii]|uniref:adhesin domain containing protein n=1 Tax=Peptoniphilus duerdenii TaxID=507750 RepID=UPI00254DE58D|nr:adhesin domain containing protein [Peptoniphilus duerdenii]MDK8275733.1 G5 domain-containing protein [Peptoniphilus duerdenii]
MERLKDVVDKKKEKSANTKPKYGMRKLSVGLVPVFLGAIVLIPGVGYAKEVSVGATSAPRTEIVGEVLSRRDDKKDEEYAIQKVEAVSNQEGLEATSTSRSSANIVVEENESINKNSKENDKEIINALNEDKSTEDHREMVKNEDRTVDEKLVSEEPQTENLENKENKENKEDKEDKEEKEEKLEISEEKKEEAQKAGEVGEQNKEDKNLQKATDLNYGEDEKKINNYNDSERYKTTDLEAGSVNQTGYNTDANAEKGKDGFKLDTLNPSETSPSKTEYGWKITIDKETGQRTYTDISVSDSGRIRVETGEKPMMGVGDKLNPNSPDVTYKPEDKVNISGRQNKLNVYASSEETLKHINNHENKSTSFGFKDNYTEDNPRVKFYKGSSFQFTYRVNPWPNENDKLEQLKLNIEKLDPDAKYFVKGQDIDTGVKVDNIDDSAKERLVGQVYHPVTGKIVPGAKAYIGNNGNIHITMPKGAINEDGSINKDSIFSKDPSYRGIQSLDVKFFARPRTAEEFKTIAETPDESGETGTYTETGAGTATINHKGKDVTIDKQGIDRYDHYNLIGNFKLNLDDTKYYDQEYKDQDGKPTKNNVFSEVEPGKDFEIKMEEKSEDDKGKYDKNPEDMIAAQDNQEATAKANLKFFLKNNRDKDGNLKPEEDRWKLSIGGRPVDLTTGKEEISVDDLSNIKITAPESAKAGQFVAIPVEYTYTNGSKDIHWFHFVVKESDNNIPTYDSEAGIADKKLSKKPEISQSEKDKKKLQPKSYKLAKTEYKDDKGNVWNVSIDETTGEVKATVPDNDKIPEGGAKLNVEVEVTYEEEVEVGDKKETRTYTEKTKAQFYAIPSTRQEVKKEYETKLPFETKVIYDDKIPAGKVVEEGGVVGKQKMVFSQIVVGDKKGALDENGKFVEGKEAVTTEVVEKAQDKIIRIGTKPAETTVEIPKGLDYELDYSKKDGEPEVVEEGNDGVVTIKTTRDPQTGEITVTKTTTTEAKNKKIKIPAGTEGTHEYTEEKPFTYDIQFDPDFYTNYPDAKDNYKIVTEGKVGEKTTKWTIKNSEIVGEPKIIKDTDPTNAVIKVGQKDYTGTITHTESHEVPFEVEYKYSDELEAGQTKVEQKGEKGSYDVEYSQKIKNGEKDGELTSTKKNEKAAKKEIIVIGTKPVTKVVEKPFNTEYQYDENLEAGKTEEETAGKNGKVTITTSYDEKEKKVVTTETEEAGQNRVVKIGGKTNGTIEILDKVAYEVEVIEDPEMEAGKTETVQEGVNGEKKTTLTIENSKEIKDSRKEEITKKPVKKIIKVGTKNVCEIPPVDPEKPEDNKPEKPSEENLGEENHNNPNEENLGEENHNKPNENVNPGEQSDDNKPNKKDNNFSNSENKEPGNAEQDKSDKESEQEKSSEAKSNPSGASSDKLEKSSEDEKSPEEPGEYNVSKNKYSETIKGKKAKINKNVNDFSKAPKTYDAGIDGYVGIAGLAASALAFLQRRKKEDEE